MSAARIAPGVVHVLVEADEGSTIAHPLGDVDGVLSAFMDPQDGAIPCLLLDTRDLQMGHEDAEALNTAIVATWPEDESMSSTAEFRARVLECFSQYIHALAAARGSTDETTSPK